MLWRTILWLTMKKYKYKSFCYCIICFIKLYYTYHHPSLQHLKTSPPPSKLVVASLSFLGYRFRFWLVTLVQALVVVRVQTISRWMNHSIPKTFSWVTVSFDLTVSAFKIHIVEDNVAARDSVAACKLDGFFAFGCPGYVTVHYLADFNRRGLHYREKVNISELLSSLSLYCDCKAYLVLTWSWIITVELIN